MPAQPRRLPLRPPNLAAAPRGRATRTTTRNNQFPRAGKRRHPDPRILNLHRPSSPQLGGNYIWLAESPDLVHWGNHRCIARTRPGMWDSARIGAGASPIRTDRGWLEIHHGATPAHRYCLGALLLDLDQPWKVIARSQKPIMEPTASYETKGFLGNVIFTNGHLIDGDQLLIYYGASDSVICAARFSIRGILATLS